MLAGLPLIQRNGTFALARASATGTTIQVHIENNRVGPGVVHRINGGCDRGKWSDKTIAVLIEGLCRPMKEP